MCHNTEEFYYRETYPKWYTFHGQLCSNDPFYYQACDIRLEGFKIKVTNSERLCENFLCLKNTIEIVSLYNLKTNGELCDDNQNCENNMDEAYCKNKTIKLRSGRDVDPSYVCDDQCEVIDCEDEAICNGLTYGIYCKYSAKWFDEKDNDNKYIPPIFICNGYVDCDDKVDELNCTVTDQTTNTCIADSDHDRETLIPVHNFTRCGVLGGKWRTNEICFNEDLKKYQSNCTDQARVGGKCKVDGYNSTVSKYVICFDDKNVKICDDRIESKCQDISKSCFNKHKHVMCDKVLDCIDRSDESHPICRIQTENTCQRRVGTGGELPIPLAWLGDGVQDCMNGIDELDIWPTCGKDKYRRLVTSDKTCKNVFLCLWGDPGFVELFDLCDGLETCGNENKICSLSRDSPQISTSVSSQENGLVKQLSFCKKGLRSISRLSDDNCTEELFIFPDHHYFGVDTKTKLILPTNVQNCDHMFGEQYVFTSCTKRCKNSVCPLKNLPRYEVCPSQYPSRIGTVAENEYLVFFTKSHANTYTNRYFVCDNKITCIDYSQVCDLVDNCGDGSDESACTNNFICDSNTRIISKTQTCDGKYDCSDMTDECSQQCSRQILESSGLKVSSLTIGGVAVLANLVIMVKNTGNLKRCRTSVALVNKALIFLISFGDFLVGCYLLVIAIYDTVIFNNGYCQRQIEWLTSFQCSTIGVVSTIGSQISLFAMTGLSTVRLNGIRGSLRVPGGVTLGKYLKVALGVVCIAMASTAIAITPVISALQDYFVNGYKFSEELRLFIGTQNKEKVLGVLEAYYGRMKETSLSWEMIFKMFRNMFSHDEGNVDYSDTVTKLEFYGNDGVCLFKYFVKRNDPQRNFVWALLALNFVCFVFISISYILIGIVSRDSSRSLANSQNRSQINERNRKMSRRITIIITTDFCCWVPFIVICVLHSIEILDATPWYSLFSMIILPINSVINPFLYDDSVTGLLRIPFHSIYTRVSNTAICQSFIAHFNTVQPEIFEMEQIGEGGHECGAEGDLRTKVQEPCVLKTKGKVSSRDPHTKKMSSDVMIILNKGGKLSSGDDTGEVKEVSLKKGNVIVEVHSQKGQQSLDPETITTHVEIQKDVSEV